MPRIDGRAADELRDWRIVPNFLRHPAGSVLISCGNTREIAAATVEDKVPQWMKNQKVPGGWLTCEYGMLPSSTGDRSKREASAGKQGGRTVEIQRLIGRSLRMAVDLSLLPEVTVTVDCDVIDADGGTRCAGITGAAVAVALACRKRGLSSSFRELTAAVSVGIVDGVPMLDLCYGEDSAAQVDMNLVMNEAGEFIEVQGTGEGRSFSRQELDELLALGEGGIRTLMDLQRDVEKNS